MTARARRPDPEGDHPLPDGAPEAAVTAARLREAAGPLAAEAVTRMTERFAWFRDLPPDERSWVGLVAQNGVTTFLHWLSHAEGPRPDVRALAGLVFGTAPAEMARVVSLQQTVELIRVTVAVVEEHAPELAPPHRRAALREAVLVFSRDVAFATAEVYARAAEQRGAWDARLEALVVDHVLRDEPSEIVLSRAAALGWVAPPALTVVVGTPPAADVAPVLVGVHEVAEGSGLQVLAGVQGERLVVVTGIAGTAAADAAARTLEPAFGAGAIVYGDPVAGLAEAAASAQAALFAARVASSWPGLPRPAAAAALLPERALAGEASARDQLVQDVYNALGDYGGDLRTTVGAFLDHGGSLEATGRSLFVHANTVRYRLRRATELTGLDLSTARGRYVAAVALTFGRLADVL
ncbi:MAG TPA: helix-turn-helix domain-containing protein [Mycobacteriales bacterium]|jgi:hypothetical protein|nr:helix-turn-helix domain-containing protein [Mycobacteriales bacterium]